MATLNSILLLLLPFLLAQFSYALNTDGLLLLSFKLSILHDPHQVLESWSPHDETPCSWRGVTCATSFLTSYPVNIFYPRVVSLSLPSSDLVGSIPSNLAAIETLQRIDLSHNSLNGSLPLSLFNSTTLQVLDLAFNSLAGMLPERFSGVLSGGINVLNLSDNVFEGKVPSDLGSLSNLTVVSLRNNYFSGEFPAGFAAVEVLDISSNLINGSLPSDFDGESLRYFNVSHNELSGQIPASFAEKIPENATLDFSFNNLTGAIPDIPVFSNQQTVSFRGNPYLCVNENDNNPCPITSSPPSSSPPAFAAIPRTLNTSGQSSPGKSKTGMKTSIILAIVAGDVAGIAIIALVLLYVYRLRKKKNTNELSSDVTTLKNEANSNSVVTDWSSSSSSSESRGFTRWSCLRSKKSDAAVAEEEQSSSDSEEEAQTEQNGDKGNDIRRQTEQEQSKRGTLVMLDGENKLELDTLLKASAYILGATSSSIMYKAVLEDGTSVAVRRIGDRSVERFKDFESQIRVVAKMVHPNLVKVRGFFWGVDEKLIIYDFVANGCLANARYRKVGSSPCHLPWEARLRIAKGVARGLGYLHERKHVHGNLKPTNILLDSDMEPKIGDFGLEKLLSGDTSYKIGSSTRNFGSKRSTTSRDGFQDFALGPSPGPSPSPSPSPSAMGTSPYHAPESLRSLKPHPKWDVYSFGVILLELITGKVVVMDELGQGLVGLPVDDPNRAFRMTDMAIRGELEGEEEAVLSLFKLGYSCGSPVPQKRPAMKEALQVLEKFPCSPLSSYHYGHL